MWRKKINFFKEAETKGKKNAIVTVRGWFFQKKCIGGDTKSKEKVIVNSVGIKIFEKSSKRVLQNRGVILIISGVEKFFLNFFQK